MKPVLTCAALAALLLPGQIQAAEPVPADTTDYTMEEVVVTATRQQEKIADVPANVTVISKTDIANSTAQSIPDLLRTEVGLTVLDITGNGRKMKVDIRGFGETAQLNTLVLVDGRRVNAPDQSGTDWSLIDLERVERIEIVRGSRGAVLYGDNATGGVINIITREGGDTLHAGAKASVGSYSTYKGSAFISGRQQDLRFNLSASHKDSDGYRDNSDTMAKDVGGNFAYDFTDALQVKWSADYHKDTSRLPGAIKQSDFDAGVPRRASLNPNDVDSVEDYYLQASPTLSFGTDNEVSLDLAYRRRSSVGFISGDSWNSTYDTKITTISASPQVILREKVAGLANVFNLGIDISEAKDDILNTGIYWGSDFNYAGRVTKKNHAAYLHDELHPFEALAVSVGLRHDQVKYEFEPSDVDSLKLDDDIYTVGVNYALQEISSVYCNYSRSFLYPDLNLLYNHSSNTVTTDFRPPSSDNYEVGVRHQFSPLLTATVNLFRMDTSDEIFYDPAAGGGWGASVNYNGTTRRDGIEVAIAANIKQLELTASYSYTDATMKDGTYADSDVPGVPTHKASAGATLTLEQGFTLGVNTVYMGKRYFESDFSNSFPEQDAYVLVNAKIKYGWKNLEAYLDINNLTDKEYAEFGVLGGWPKEESYYPSPERNFLLGVSVTY